MAEHSPAKKRRIKIPEIEREYWRRAFFDDVHGRRRVQNLIEQDLRPLWRNVGSDVPIPETAAQWDAYLEAAKSGTVPVPPSHVAFSSRLDEIVRDTLRCRIN